MPYKIHSLELDVDSFGVDSEIIVPIESLGIANNPELEARISAGDRYPRHIALISHNGLLNVDTVAIPTALDATTLGPLAIVTTTEPGVTAYLQSFDDAGAPDAGSVHRSLKISSGVVVPRRLTVDHRGTAMLSIDVIILKETGNDALVISDVAALPTITSAATASRWTLGPITLGSVVLADYTQVEIDFGNVIETRGVQSDIYDAYVEVSTTAPKITITGIDPAWFAAAAVPIGGLVCTHADTTVYFRKRSDDGDGFVINATAEHLKFTIDGLAVLRQAATGAAHRFTETAVEVTGRDDGSNAPLIVDTSSAIT